LFKHAIRNLSDCDGVTTRLICDAALPSQSSSPILVNLHINVVFRAARPKISRIERLS
jgi:hypothetical protein